jgi:hypothetical protein
MTQASAGGPTSTTSVARATPRPVPRPADGLLHPVALGALLVLVVNDQVLKPAWPSVVTGKLSDVAGLIVAPLALQAAWEFGQWLLGRWSGPSARALAVAIAVVGVGFVLVQVWPPATDAYRGAMALAQWPFRALGSILAGGAVPDLAPVRAVGDAEDLLALPALAVSWWVGSRRSAGPAPAAGSSTRG